MDRPKRSMHPNIYMKNYVRIPFPEERIYNILLIFIVLHPVPWTARRSNQSILSEISPEYSLEGLMLKLQLLWPCDAKNWLIGKDPEAGKDWGQEEKRTTEDETVGWHHQSWVWANFHDGQGSLACCSPWGRQRVVHDSVTEVRFVTAFLPRSKHLLIS